MTFRILVARAVAIAAAILLASSSLPPASAAPIASVSGTVTLAGQPVAGSTLTLIWGAMGENYTTTTTGSAGEFTFVSLEPGSYTLRVVETTEHRSFSTSFTLSTASPNRTVNPVLAPWAVGTSRISGTVVDAATGEPLPTASVQFDGGGVAAPRSVTLDDQGNYEIIDLPSGAFSIYLYLDGYVTKRVPISIPTDTAQDLTLTLAAADSVMQVHVQDVDGTPLSGIFVNFSIDGQSLNSVSTDPDGNVTVTALAAGTYTVSAGTYQWKSQTTSVSTSADSPGSVTFVLEPRIVGSISGSVTTTAGAPIAGICVAAYDAALGIDITGTTTDSTGAYTVGDLEQGSYKLYFGDCDPSRGAAMFGQAYLGGGASIAAATVIELDAGEELTGRTIALSRGGSLSGRVDLQAADGPIPVPDSREPNLSLYRLASGQWEPVQVFSGFASAGAVGNYQVHGLAAGTYRLGAEDRVTESSRTYAARFWPSATSLQAARDLVVMAAKTRTGVNLVLQFPRPVGSPEPVATEELLAEEEDRVSAPTTAKQTQIISVTVGSEYAGEWVAVWGHSTPTLMGSWVQVSRAGTVKVTVPATLESGEHRLVAQDADGSVVGWKDLAVAGGPYPTTAVGSISIDHSLTPLRASTTGWPSGTTFSYQWYRSATSTSTSTAITGARTDKYTPTAADRGKYLRVRVTATVPGYAATARYSAAGNYTIGSTTGTLTLQSAPKVGAAVGVQNTLNYSLLGAPIVPTSTTYQWLRNGVSISGARSETYTPAPADYAAKISVRVTAGYPGGLSLTRTSPSATVGLGNLLGSLELPTISVSAGPPTVLTAVLPVGYISTPGVTHSYQWFRNGVVIPGATKNTYRIVAADTGKSLTVRVTSTKSKYSSVKRVSEPATF